MQKKLTLSINAEIYEALHKMAGKRKIGRFIEDIVRPYIESFNCAKERPAQEEEPEPVLPWTRIHGADPGELR
jgi:hypothetical protein